MINSMEEALDVIFRTRRRLDAAPRGLDEHTRDPGLTRQLLQRAGLPAMQRHIIVVTGSRGKGSVSSITAKLLEQLGYRVGLLTSPHLRHWNERIRVQGRMISDDDFLRILSQLQPHIDALTDSLPGKRYLSPQGIFLAMALRYFDECAVNAAVLEVGRGGRFDDVAVLQNSLALFTPIMLEHTALLGDALGRIAWHKAGIICPGSQAISLPQAPEVLEALGREAAAKEAALRILGEPDLARWLGDRGDGQAIMLHPYGQLMLPLLGRYQLDNAALAIRAVEALLEQSETGVSAAAISRGLQKVKWQGRVQKLSDAPAIFVDGAITIASAESFIASVGSQLRQPVAAICGIPIDRDFAGVYRVMARVSQSLILTETDINRSTRFPDREDALRAARLCCGDAHHAGSLEEALTLARRKCGETGTILLAVSLMLVGECMLIWDIDTAQI